MNNEKQIAQAILDAQELYRGSYSEEDGVHIPDEESCFRITCKQQGLSSNMWALLSLANHWCDVQLWAEDILAGRDVGAGENCPCDVASKEACEQCRETDSDGNLLDSCRR